MADVAELTETSTKEDIDQYVEQVVKEVEEERAGEQPEKKSDAQIASEHATANKTEQNTQSAENTSGSDTADVNNDNGENTAEVEDQGDDTAKADTGDDDSSWMNDELKAEAAAFGIEESELAEFASREELERALRLFDKSALEAGRKALAEADSSDKETGQPRNEKGQFAKKEETPQTDQPKRDGQYEFKEDIYDEDLEADLKGFRDYLDARLEALEARFAEADARLAEADAIAKERHFDSLVDSLGHPDLFGKTDQETEKEKQRRTDLFVEAETYLRGREALGRPTELNQVLLNRIARTLFAEELGKKELKKRTQKISRQSNRRMGGGVTRPQDPREDPREEAERLYRELERA